MPDSSVLARLERLIARHGHADRAPLVHEHDAAYVNVAGDSAITGLLTSTNSVRLQGSTAADYGQLEPRADGGLSVQVARTVGGSALAMVVNNDGVYAWKPAQYLEGIGSINGFGGAQTFSVSKAGVVTLNADPVGAMEASTKQYVDNKSTTATWTVDSGWIDYGSPFTGLHASRTGNIVTITGLIKKQTADLAPGANVPFTISTSGVPSGFRPSTTVISHAITTNSLQNNSACRVDFDSTGKIQGHINVAGNFGVGTSWIAINATYRAA